MPSSLDQKLRVVTHESLRKPHEPVVGVTAVDLEVPRNGFCKARGTHNLRLSCVTGVEKVGRER